MGMGFGLSVDDVLVVLERHGIQLPERQAERLFDDLDHDSVEHAALEVDGDMDEQTEAAYQDLWRQLQDSEPVRAALASEKAVALESTLPAAPPRPGPRM